MSAPPSLAVILVSHDGATWLPGVLEGLAEQHGVSQVVALDTGSRDASRELITAAASSLPPTELIEMTSATSFPQAVARGLETLAAQANPPTWVWLLHDDARPAPGALTALLTAAEQHPDVDIFGPKLREWPSLRRLLEVGVTISGTGRRETGLERGEYDQGQHDEETPVLAVNTAGMLVRREVLMNLGGLDPRLPMFGNDLDLGWRAAVAGHQVLVVPHAVVFHAEAAHRGARRTALTGRHTHYQERRAALYVLLVNARARSLPWRIVRLTFGTFLRMIGFLLVRAPGEALDDLAALVAVVFRPGQLLAGRRERAARGGDPARVKPLLAPAWTPYRHGLDFVGDVASALTNQAADVAERRRIAAAEADPSSLAAARVRSDDEDDLADTGPIAGFFTNPIALTMMALVALLIVGARTALGAVSGGALSRTPSDASSWWGLYVEGFHRVGFGTDVPAPPYVGMLALPASILTPSGVMSVLLVIAAPVALWGAWRFLRVAGRLVTPRGAPRWILVAGAATYATVAAASGAWGSGRWTLVVAVAVLPWLAHAALGFADPDGERRWRAGWRVGLLTAVISALAPSAWVLMAALALVVVIGGLVIAPATMRRLDVLGPVAATVGVPVVLLLPWWLPVLLTTDATALVMEQGRPPSGAINPLDMWAGRVAEHGAPLAVGILLTVLAVAALLPRLTRIPVVLCWALALVATAVAAGLSTVTYTSDMVNSPAGIGILVLVVRAALIAAVVLGALGMARSARVRSVAAVRVAAVAAAVVGAVVPLAGVATLLLEPDDLTSETASEVPAYMLQSGAEGPEHGVLVVRGTLDTGLQYSLRRGDGITVGQDEVLALSRERTSDRDLVGRLLGPPTPGIANDVARLGIEYVLLPAPADARIAANLDATAGLGQASSGPGSRAWQIQHEPTLPDPDGGAAVAWRPWLLAAQALGLLGVLVQCAPTVRTSRSAHARRAS